MLSCHPDPFAAFCNDLQIPGCEVHLYDGPKTFHDIIHMEKIDLLGRGNGNRWDETNVYFLAGVRPGLQARAADADVLKRSMFTLDFDIRKELEKKSAGPVPDEAISLVAYDILGSLLLHGDFSQFRYAVLSGNGLHVHYFGTPVDVVKEEWAAGMKHIFALVNDSLILPCDTGCHNAGRIMRMPGSWNVKDPTNKKPVTFLAWNPHYTFERFESIQAWGRQDIEEAAKKKAQEAAEFESSGKEASTVIALINQIPIEQVVKQLPLGIVAHVEKKDGGLRFRDEAGVERGFFKHHQYNIVVHEGTSLFPAPAGVGYNCLGLVKTVLKMGTPAAILWFCDRSTPVREAAEKEKAEWAAEQASSEVAFIDSILPPPQK
jgi:hypothetical protein